jgi:hypothetical protein
LTAAVQKRRFVTRYRRNQPAFLVDRARLAVVPVGLEFVTMKYTGQSILPGTAGGDFASRILGILGETLGHEGLNYNLEAILDSSPLNRSWPIMSRPTGFAFLDHSPLTTHHLPTLEEVAGLTSWNGELSPVQQIQAGGALHALAGAGTQWILLPPSPSTKEEDMVGLLRTAWKETQVSRLRFIRLNNPGRQLAAPWEVLAK